MQYFRVKNLEKYQYYLDRRPGWIKLYSSVVHGYEFSSLQDISKLHLLMIFLEANLTDNRLPYDNVWIGGLINATEDVDLDMLVEHGFLEIITS